MGIQEFGNVLLTLLAATPFTLLLLSLSASGERQVLTTTLDVRKKEADRLFNQGKEQHQNRQYKSALQSWHFSLSLYRKIKDAQGEGKSLSNIGVAYFSLGDYQSAIDYQQRYLIRARLQKRH